jgi:hypothetical protein
MKQGRVLQKGRKVGLIKYQRERERERCSGNLIATYNPYSQQLFLVSTSVFSALRSLTVQAPLSNLHTSNKDWSSSKCQFQPSHHERIKDWTETDDLQGSNVQELKIFICYHQLDTGNETWNNGVSAVKYSECFPQANRIHTDHQKTFGLDKAVEQWPDWWNTTSTTWTRLYDDPFPTCTKVAQGLIITTHPTHSKVGHLFSASRPRFSSACPSWWRVATLIHCTSPPYALCIGRRIHRLPATTCNHLLIAKG